MLLQIQRHSRKASTKAPFESVGWDKYRGIYEKRIFERDLETGKITTNRLFIGASYVSQELWFDLKKVEDRHLIREVQRLVRTHPLLDVLREWWLEQDTLMFVVEIAIYIRSLGIKPENEVFGYLVVEEGREIYRKDRAFIDKFAGNDPGGLKGFVAEIMDEISARKPKKPPSERD